MAISDPPVTTYSDTTAHKRAVADLISIIDPTDTPEVAYFGLNGSPAAFRIQNFPVTKVEWLEDSYAALTDTLGASCDTTTVLVTVSDATKIKIGHVLEIDLEMMWVSAKNTSTNVLTVTRDYGGTAASHANSATVTIVNQARLESAPVDYDYKTDVTAAYNYTQIFERAVQISGSHMVLQQWGISDEMAYQVDKKTPEMFREIAKAFYRGQRKTGTATTPRAWGGVETFVTDNTASQAGAALTQKAIEDLVQAIWEDGGNPTLMICGAWVKRMISGFYEDTVRTERLEDQGGVVIDSILTHFGTLQVLMSRWCPKTKLYILSPEHIGFIPYRPFFTQDIAIGGDYVGKEIIGEYTLVVRQDKAHGFIKSIATTS